MFSLSRFCRVSLDVLHFPDPRQLEVKNFSKKEKKFKNEIR